ncbi:MAG: orotate phosphoribosyltransferase [Aggregatilineales bacterium]
MLEQNVARALLAIRAVGFTPDKPVTFRSGLLSPVYVDNRQLIFWPEQWRVVIEGFQQVIAQTPLVFDVIAGIETAGIPHSSALAYTLGVPSVFVRKQPKEHGTRSKIEGGGVAGQRVLLIEDLVTTGSSSLAGVEALRAAGAIVDDCLAITSYGFPVAQRAFAVMGVRLHLLTPFALIARTALEQGYLTQEALDVIEDWMRDPHGWMEQRGLTE